MVVSSCTEGSVVFLDVLEHGSTLLRRLHQRLLEQVIRFQGRELCVKMCRQTYEGSRTLVQQVPRDECPDDAKWTNAGKVGVDSWYMDEDVGAQEQHKSMRFQRKEASG
jgi:hypothetical protein